MAVTGYYVHTIAPAAGKSAAANWYNSTVADAEHQGALINPNQTIDYADADEPTVLTWVGWKVKLTPSEYQRMSANASANNVEHTLIEWYDDGVSVEPVNPPDIIGEKVLVKK